MLDPRSRGSNSRGVWLLPRTAAMKASLHEHCLPTPRVLIVEDNIDVADALEQLLQLQGYETRVAADGAVGLAIATQFDPHFVLLDLQLPSLQGGRVAQHLRIDGEHRHRVIIGMTGNEALYGASHEAFHHRLSKPIAPESLLALLEAEWADHFKGTPYEH